MVIFIIESSFNLQDNYYIITLSLFTRSNKQIKMLFNYNLERMIVRRQFSMNVLAFVSIQQQQVAEKGEKIENK